MVKKVKYADLFYVDSSGIHGRGVFAKRPLKQGSYLGTYAGPVRTCFETAGPYVLWVAQDDGNWLGRDGRNVLRYLNHHHDPNCQFDGFDLYALCHIPTHAELTIHYGEEFIEAIDKSE